MSWFSLGTISPSYEWQLFSVPIVQGKVFRFTHNYSVVPYGNAVLCSVFVDNSRYGFRKIYASQDANIIYLPISQDLIEAGLIVRYIAIKLGLWTRLQEGTNWSITAEVYEPDEPG